MKEKSTTKPQPYVSTWSLSRACQAIMGLGICKIALFVALGFGYTLPDFGLLSPLPEKGRVQENSESEKNDNPQEGWGKIKNSTSSVATAPGATQLHKLSQASAQVSTHATLENASQNTAELTQQEPQGSAAVRAAVAHKSKYTYPKTTLDVMPATQQVQKPAPVQEADDTASNAVYNTPKAKLPEAEDTSWWSNFFSMKSLPFPRLGVDQVAYAATLDAPPPPPPPSSDRSSSPFTPPAQLAPVQSAQQTGTQPEVRPAGVAGPQMSPDTSNNPLVLPSTPPAPNVKPYVAPESASQKEQELARREQEILALKQQMEQRLKELQNAERKVQGMLNEAKDVENNKMSSLTNMYVNMKPRQAGLALEKLDESIAAKILANMKSKQAGEIMSYMNPEVTAKLTELLTRMRLGQ